MCMCYLILNLRKRFPSPKLIIPVGFLVLWVFIWVYPSWFALLVLFSEQNFLSYPIQISSHPNLPTNPPPPHPVWSRHISNSPVSVSVNTQQALYGSVRMGCPCCFPAHHRGVWPHFPPTEDPYLDPYESWRGMFLFSWFETPHTQRISREGRKSSSREIDGIAGSSNPCRDNASKFGERRAPNNWPAWGRESLTSIIVHMCGIHLEARLDALIWSDGYPHAFVSGSEKKVSLNVLCVAGMSSRGLAKLKAKEKNRSMFHTIVQYYTLFIYRHYRY